MSDINVRIVGTANMAAIEGPVKALRTQIAGLNTQLAEMVALQDGVDGRGFARMAQAADLNSKAFRNAAASTGMFEVQQLRVNRQTDDYIKKLKAQQMSFRELRKTRDLGHRAFLQQLAQEQMMVRKHTSGITHGRDTLDVLYPKQLSAQTITAAKNLSFLNEQVKSGAHQMINWGKNTQWAGRQLMVGLTMPVLAFGAAAGVMAYQIDKELTRVQKVYNTTATEGMAMEKELAQVRVDSLKTATTAAKEYGASATDTLQVQAELAATGLTGAKLQESTTEVMRIARLGEIDHQDAMQATIALQSVFRMSTEDLTKAFNYMNSVENATSLQTADFAAAIPIAAAPVKQFGGDIYELGILLTAMKERGIEATQGANAIKSAMQRLGRPSKQIQEEFTALTGADITKIFDKANSLTEIFQAINDVTKDLSKQDKTKVFAGLFGSYQVTRMSALVEGMDDLEQGVGQVSTAYNLTKDAPKAWADTAEREMNRYKESVSGQFEIALNTMKLTLQDFGKPFIEVATYVMRFLTGVMDGFNRMPKAVKILAAVGIGVAALAGPFIMMLGLFGNLFGQGLRFGTMLVDKLVPSMQLLTTEERAALAASEMYSGGLVKQRTETQLLTAAIEAHTAAQAEANAMTRAQFPAVQAAALPGVVTGASAPAGSSIYRVDLDGAKRAEDAAKGQLHVAQQTAAVEKKRTGALAASAGWMGVGLVSMIAMEKASSENGRNIAKWVMYGSMVVPAVIMVAQSAKSAATWFMAAATGANATAAGSIRAAWGTRALASAAAVAARGFAFMFGPIGLASMAIAAIALIIYKLWKDHREAQKEAWRQQNALTHSTEDWAKAAGQARKEYERIPTVGTPEEAGMGANLEEDYKYYKEETSGKYVVKAMEARSSTEQDRIAMQQLIELQSQYGLSAERAKVNVQAMFMAMGYGADQAKYRVEGLAKEIGGLGSKNWDEILANARDVFNDALDPTRLYEMSEEGRESTIKNQVEKFAEIFSAGFARAKTPQQANKVFDELDRVTMERWDKLLVRMQEGSSKVRDFLEEEGIGSGKELSQWWRKQGKQFEGSGMPSFATVGGYDPIAMFQASAVAADDLEANVIGAIRELNHLQSSISTTAELQYNYNMLAQMLTYDQAVKSVKQLAREMLALQGQAFLGDEVSKGYYNLSKAQQEMQRFRSMTKDEQGKFSATMEAFAVANNIKLGKNALQTYHNILNNVKNKTKDTEEATKAWARAVTYTKDELNSVQQSAMSGVQEDIADDIRSAFDDRMESSLEARQNMWDRRADALSNNIEKRQEALENEFERRELAMDRKWEAKTDKAEAYWDRRAEAVEHAIEVEQKAEEKRQKMFDAEIARINKLNEAYNRNIDFNVALNTGKFDEAAKIRNDAAASTAQTALERAQNAGSAQSARRIDRLEGRQENLEKARERFMKDLQKREDAERRHLAKLREMREKALERQSEAQQKALERATEADMEAQQEIWENRKESLDEQLELFTSFIARNEKELRQHMRDVGLSYKDFGERVLKPRGENWAQYFGSRMKYHIRQSGLELASDKMWEQLGKRSVEQMVKGMGFKNIGEFKHFVKTGEWSGGGGAGKSSGSGDATAGPSDTGNQHNKTHHAGGMVGRAKDSRQGVARTLRGLHPSEEMIRAQKGEYLVNRDATQKNLGLLEGINSGARPNFDIDAGRVPKGKRRTGGVGMGPAGVMAGMLSAMFMAGANKAFESAKGKAKDKWASAGSGKFAPGKAGMYSDRYFGREQLNNASTIASVGKSMGMSNRDIMIGIMTAITESGLINIHGGDRDSQGLFQQRPSMGWGTVAQVTDPKYAARKFFSVLKQHPERGGLTPWMAAQSVQRSAFSDGSNYHQYWDNAQAIYKGLKAVKQPGGGAGFVQGAGGRHRPVAGTLTQGIHDSYTGFPAVDIGTSVGHPVYAAADGRVTRSYDLVGNDGRVSNGGYYSYGRVIYIDHGPFSTLYAHLNDRYARAGQQVKGGSVIGKSGNTGHSFGPHLHFGASGISPYAFLKKGAANIRFDNTIANLHKGEAVLTEDLNRKFHEGVDRFAEGPSTVYDVDVHVEGTNASIDDITKAVTAALKKADAKRARPRRR